MSFAAITGWGIGLPRRTATNADLARRIEGVDDAWIVRRTGITRRHIAGPGETTSSLSIDAARAALARAGLLPADIDLIVVATCTPDRLIPGTAPLVQAGLGARNAGAFDLNAACAGFLSALAAADSMIRAGTIGRALVIGAEVLSRFVDWTDPKTCVLFGDGAGAVVLERTEETAGLAAVRLGADGAGVSLLEVPAGGSARPASQQTLDEGAHTVRMNGPEVFRVAVRVLSEGIEDAARAAGFAPADADLVICHQANQRIIAEVGARTGVPAERLFSNVARYGNTSAASIPIALFEAAEQGLLGPGARVVLSAIGAGFTWASGVVRWTAPRVERRSERTMEVLV